MGRLLNEELLPRVIDAHRRMGHTLVTTNGCFDILHVGHVRMLAEAKAQGDVLIVGLNSDQSVRANKGPARPFVPDGERAEVLCALECVDYVVLFDEPECIPFVKRVRPDVHVNDSDYGEGCIERDAVLAGGGRLHIVQKIPGHSTSGLIERIRRNEGAPPAGGAA